MVWVKIEAQGVRFVGESLPWLGWLTHGQELGIGLYTARQWSPGRLEGTGFEAPIPITLRTGR